MQSQDNKTVYNFELSLRLLHDNGPEKLNYIFSTLILTEISRHLFFFNFQFHIHVRSIFKFDLHTKNTNKVV